MNKIDNNLTAGKPLDEMSLPAGIYPVAIHIGNPDDITIRALEVLRKSDAIVCEERRDGIRFLKSIGIEKPLHFLNEHSKSKEIKLLFDELLLMKDKVIALITDAGTPCFADPGNELVQLCHDYDVNVYPVPGASSLMAALMCCGLQAKRFLYYGFLSAKKDERISELKQLKTTPHLDIIFLEAPYRLKNILEDMSLVLGKKRRIRLFYKLTQPEQAILIGTLEEITNQTTQFPKGEFILILEHESQR